MLLRDFVNRLETNSPRLSATLTVADFVRFVSLAGQVQQRAGPSLRLTATRNVLQPFLELALSPSYPTHLMIDLWRLSFPLLGACQIDSLAAIREFGLHPDLTIKMPERFLQAPTSKCFLCSHDRSSALHVHSSQNGYLYDSDGVHAIQTVILRCSSKPSYYTRDGLRIYYSQEMGRDEEYLHIHCHYYMTRRLAYMFRVIQMLAHVSHFNLVNWYDQIFVDDTPVPTFVQNQSFSPSISEEVCRDGLILHSLMNHADRRGTHLAVTSSGTDTIRFDSAIEAHLELLSVEGTRYRDHFCSSCVRLTSGVDPETGEHFYRAIRAIVTDGLTIGHWRCSASTQQLEQIAANSGQPVPEGPCTNKLANINDRLCPEHFAILGGLCRAQPCQEAALGETQTSMLNRPGSNLPSDPTVHLNASTAQLEDMDILRQADESQRAHESARDGGLSQAAGKLIMTKARTHNDQLAVGTCGITLARKTFYNAESVSAVKEFLEESFPHGMPEVVFYDNACRLTEHIYTGDTDRTSFLGTVIPVDPFHHRSHAESDEFCKRFTDPKLFPDIQKDGKWIFNASAAELTNIWYGGFASICRNMHSLVYNFFLEEMVYLRNTWLTKKLDKRPGMEFLGEGPL
ncbi:hypothetical protein DFH28DRAFT_1193006 [Melampsora americana]|nr:hypothetical protein DFH28DRAFT_1193006 [Melampsora americana]